jgi:hypothetical protein
MAEACGAIKEYEQRLKVLLDDGAGSNGRL